MYKEADLLQTEFLLYCVMLNLVPQYYFTASPGLTLKGARVSYVKISVTFTLLVRTASFMECVTN